MLKLESSILWFLIILIIAVQIQFQLNKIVVYRGEDSHQTWFPLQLEGNGHYLMIVKVCLITHISLPCRYKNSLVWATFCNQADKTVKPSNHFVQHNPNLLLSIMFNAVCLSRQATISLTIKNALLHWLWNNSGDRFTRVSFTVSFHLYSIDLESIAD